MSDRLRRLLLVFPEEEKILLAKHLGGYLSILAKKEGLEIAASAEEYFEGKEAVGMLAYLEKELRKSRKEGWEEGREEGRGEGQLEMGISFALAMLENNEPEEKILRYTGFTPEQLAEIRDGRLRNR